VDAPSPNVSSMCACGADATTAAAGGDDSHGPLSSPSSRSHPLCDHRKETSAFEFAGFPAAGSESNVVPSSSSLHVSMISSSYICTFFIHGGNVIVLFDIHVLLIIQLQISY
jgi:hypothetical protein